MPRKAKEIVQDSHSAQLPHLMLQACSQLNIALSPIDNAVIYYLRSDVSSNTQKTLEDMLRQELTTIGFARPIRHVGYFPHVRTTNPAYVQ
jgi:hypothetical protein